VQDGTTLNTSLPPMSMVTTLTSLLRRWSVLRVRNLSTAAGNWESISDAVVAPPTARFSSASLRQPSDRNLAGQLLAQQVIQQGHVGGRSAVRGAGAQVGGAVEFGDLFGDALASGDFDNDGFADLGAGAPGETVGSVMGPER
jgi:hypothetical protein